MTDFPFANLTGGLLARKGEARPAAGMVLRSSISCSAPVRRPREIGFARSFGAAQTASTPQPVGLNASQAAAYVGVPTATFLGLVEQGLFSAPREFGWDLQALDAAFDALSDLTRTPGKPS
jgi:hypothetical protein